MDAAARAALGVTAPVAVTAAAPDVLRPIVRLACRVVEADEAVGLARAVDMRDGSTGRHSESVAELARNVGERLGMSATQLWRLELAARLHDVGKIGIPDAILKKRGPLDTAEWRLMRRHAEMGAR